MQRTLRLHHVTTSIRRASTRRAPPQPPRNAQRSSGFKSPPAKATDAERPATIPSRPQKSPTPPPPPRPEDKPTSNGLTPSRALPWVLASILAGGLGFYVVSLYVAATQPCTNPAVATLAAQKDVSGRYDETADRFDAEVGLSEWLMGVNGVREKLARQCKGHVLEASCGTGRNLGYFDLKPGSAVESLTFVDLSPQMVEVCRRKWDVLVGGERERVEDGTLRGFALPAGMKPSLVVRFLAGSVLDDMPAPPEIAVIDGEKETAQRKQKYTTILQTMGLCSTPSPHALLASLARHLDTADPDARILLLEHGRSYHPWLNRVLDNSAEKHAEIHGCWFNRDIGAIVEEAARGAGLEVKRVRRRHLGTTWVFEVGAGEALLMEGKRREEIDTAGGERKSTEGRWSAWLPWK